MSCYSVGGCYHCRQKRQLDEDRDLHVEERLAKREEVELVIHQYDGQLDQPKHKATQQAKENERSWKETQVMKAAIKSWREDKYLEVLDDIDICLDAFMSDKELQRIVKFKITSIDSFDNPAVRRPGHLEWRTELLQVILDTESSEAYKRDELEEKRRIKELAAKEKKQERDHKTLARQERIHASQTPSSSSRTLAVSQGAPPATFIDDDGSFFHPVSTISHYTPPVPINQPSTPVPATHISILPQGRPINTIRLGPNGRPIVSFTPPTTSQTLVAYGYPSPITPTATTFNAISGSSGFQPYHTSFAGPSCSSGVPQSAASTSYQTPIRFMDPIVNNYPAHTISNLNPQATPSRPPGRPSKLKTPKAIEFKMYSGPPVKR